MQMTEIEHLILHNQVMIIRSIAVLLRCRFPTRERRQALDEILATIAYSYHRVLGEPTIQPGDHSPI